MKKIILIVAAAITTGAYAQQASLETGIKMYKYHKFGSAREILAPLADKDPLANYYLGLAYLDAGDAQKANTIFLKYPEDPANISGTARAAFASGDKARAMQIAKDLAAKAKKKEWIPSRYAADALAYSDGGDPQLAKTWYTDALTKTDDADLHIGLGDTYRKIPGGGGEAMNNYEHVTDKDPKNSLAFSRIGDLWYEARNYPSALESYAKAKSADSTNPLPYKALANAYTRSGKYQVALHKIKRYLELSDKTTEDKINYLEALYRAQSSCDAAKYASELMTAGPLTGEDKVKVIGVLGYSQADCGDSVEALKNLRMYFSLQNPVYIKSGDYIQLGKLYLKLNLLDSADLFFKSGIKRDTARNKSDSYRMIAEAFKTKKDYCRSADWYNTMITADPATQATDYAWGGIMYYYCKDYGKAMTAFNSFAVKYPELPQPYYWQGRTAAAVDSQAATGGAIEYYKKWFDKVGPNYEKKAELKGAYEYVLYYYFNKKDKENMVVYKEKIRAIDPANRTLKEIEEAEKAPAGKKDSGKK
jgi:hypothetical protein